MSQKLYHFASGIWHFVLFFMNKFQDYVYIWMTNLLLKHTDASILLMDVLMTGTTAMADMNVTITFDHMKMYKFQK